MSVVVKDEARGKHYLYTKGADNVMLAKIDFKKSSTFTSDAQLQESVLQDLHSYSCEGYRTLVIGMKRLSQTEVEQLLIKQAEIQATAEDPESDLASLYSQMETDLKYLGCTAIEDKLQEGVPDTIANLIEANIRFWVLTGDKLVSLFDSSTICDRKQH